MTRSRQIGRAFDTYCPTLVRPSDCISYILCVTLFCRGRFCGAILHSAPWPGAGGGCSNVRVAELGEGERAADGGGVTAELGGEARAAEETDEGETAAEAAAVGDMAGAGAE